MSDPVIVVAQDAPPVARVLAQTLRRAATDPGLAASIRSLRGGFALRSAKDPQAATIRFGDGKVEVVGGIDKEALVVVTADLDRMGQPGAPKPKVEGALRHPLFAMKASKVLEPKPAGGWREAVRDFVSRAEGRGGLPDPLLVVCEDDRSELRIGRDGSPRLEIHGSADALKAVFVGDAHPGEAWLGGRIKVLADFETVQRFAGLAQALMFGT